jgi:hypothetical protein
MTSSHPEDGDINVSEKLVNMYNLHGVISRKTLIFISTALRASNQQHVEEECRNVINVS